MKRNIYSTVLALCLIGTIPAIAQTQIGPKKPVNSANTNESSIELNRQPVQPVRNRGNVSASPSIPLYDQIHSDIRWYALENANNAQYWKGVNTESVWLELEIGRSIQEPAIASFLNQAGLEKIKYQSRRTQVTNFFVFDAPGMTKEALLPLIKAAQNVDGILFMEPSVKYQSQYTPNDPLYQYQWGPYVSYFDEAWEYGIGGNSMNVVAVIDDACDWNHEDLYDQVWYGWDYVFNDFDISPEMNGELPDDHGTHVTGTIAATTNNNVGVAGMVNDTVFFAKVGDGVNLSDPAIIAAVYEIADIPRVSVVNMSLGAESPSAAMEQACNYAWNAGKLLLVASGNNGQGFISWPAAYLSCVAVGSIGSDGPNLYLTAYSQYGNEQELCAPGGDMQTNFGIVSTLPGNNYGDKEGTSMATPHVTGLAGLMKNLNPNLTNSDLRNILAATAFDYGDAGWDSFFGFGMINAVGAIEAALGINSSTQNTSESFFALYPNPASDRLFIDNKTTYKSGVYEIFDITGKTVKSIPVNSQVKTVIDLNDLTQGVYIIRLRSNEGTASTRFIKS